MSLTQRTTWRKAPNTLSVRKSTTTNILILNIKEDILKELKLTHKQECNNNSLNNLSQAT